MKTAVFVNNIDEEKLMRLKIALCARKQTFAEWLRKRIASDVARYERREFKWKQK